MNDSETKLEVKNVPNYSYSWNYQINKANTKHDQPRKGTDTISPREVAAEEILLGLKGTVLSQLSHADRLFSLKYIYLRSIPWLKFYLHTTVSFVC